MVIVSNDGFNETPEWKSIIVVPISTSINQARRPSAIPLFIGESGLSQDSVALCHQVTTIDKSKLLTRLGSLEDERMAEIELGLKAAMRML